MTASPSLPQPDVPAPDENDWTWVLDQACPHCGFDPSAINGRDVASTIRASVPRWLAVLARPEAAQRPSPQVWSAAEYAAHITDVFTVFDARTRQMLSEDDPLFANWDQDRTAIEKRYWEQHPDQIGRYFVHDVAHHLHDVAG